MLIQCFLCVEQCLTEIKKKEDQAEKEESKEYGKRKKGGK